MAENECLNFAGLFTTKVIKTHVKLHVKSDAQKVNWQARVQAIHPLTKSLTKTSEKWPLASTM